MIVYKCLNCKTQVVNLEDKTPRSCQKCLSGSLWMLAVADANGPLPCNWTDAAQSTSTARWTPDN